MPRRRRTFLFAWLALLAVSHAVTALRGREARLAQGQRAALLRAVERGELAEARVRIAYRDAPPQGAGAELPLLLLHGSPGSGRDFDAIAPELSRRRLLVPDLAGFGSSERRLPDYSMAANARYALQLLDELELEEVHVLGFSMGGGIAAILAELAPERVRSITLLSALGVQELELFGDHRLNRLVHALQLGLVQMARHGLPHMGLMEEALVGHPYARSFYDSDQRPLRGHLERFEGPMLILHGERDFLVPAAAAREHHRIVPQSELRLFPGGHFLVWTDPEPLARAVEEFLGRVEAGAAVTRAGAAKVRAARAREPFDPRSIPPASGPALFVLVLLIVAGTLVSEDLTCIGAGLFVAQGRIDFLPATLACFAGIYLGDMLLYVAGRTVGRPALAYPPLRWVVRPHRLAAAGEWFQRTGLKAVFITRLLPGLRLPIYFAAGLLRTRFFAFAFYFFVAAAIWTPALVGFSALAGLEADRSLDLFKRFSLPVFLGFALLLLLLERVGLRLLTQRGRRILVGSWRRKRHFEFWPPWVFYAPVALYVAWLALKHRSLALVTAVNPGIPTGGFIGESKSRILDALESAGGPVARHLLLCGERPAAERIDAARDFLRERALDFPVVLKPDVGQRGSGVCIVDDARRLAQVLDGCAADLILQEHVTGREFGVFYRRLPGEERGRVTSIVEKRIPEVLGDGLRTLEQLVLDDERAVCMAPAYFRGLAGRLLEVPARGERVPLVRIGTHCRGAVFLDASWLRTPALEAEIDRVSRALEGFYFGRYDLRAASAQELREGRGYRILELNGLTGEAAHVYDPRHSLLDAWRVLCEHWRVAFEIARQNRARGAVPDRLGHLWRELLAYRRQQAAHPELNAKSPTCAGTSAA